MLLRLLINDLCKGKLTNFMIIVFIGISSLLSCASISLLYSSMNQVSYFMDTMGNVADYNFSMMNVTKDQENQILQFLDDQQIQDYELSQAVNLPITAMKFEGHEELFSAGCFVTTIPEHYNLMFDENSDVLSMKEGEVGIPLSMKTQLDLELGDTFTILRGEQSFTYSIQSFTRDSLYGSEMMGQKRILLHPSDYEKQAIAAQPNENSVILSVKTTESSKELETQMQAANLPNYILVTKETASLAFMGAQAGTSSLMFVSGIVLLCISFLIIRYTILFQLEENYTQIGILKAIGLQYSQIKPLYLIKYLGITLIASITGFLISIPFANFMKHLLAGVVPIMSDGTGLYLSMSVILFMILLVYSVTSIVFRRLKKQSAMDAIRKGNEGETYQSHAVLSLKNRPLMNISLYLASSEILASIKHTSMIIFIYAFSIILVLFPLTLKDSLEGGAFLQVLKLSIADLYTQQDGGISIEALQEKRDQLQFDLEAYDPLVEVYMETMTSAVITEDELNTSGFLMKRAKGNDDVQFDLGKSPVLDNEIALSSTLAKLYDKTVGDSVEVSLEGRKDTYLITGLYTSMMNLGNNMLAGKDLTFDYSYTGFLVVYLSGSDEDKVKTIQTILQEYDGMQVIDIQEHVFAYTGDMLNQMKIVCEMMITIIYIVIFAITVLFSKMQLIKNKKGIAILQSLGYPRKNIRHMQMIRCIMQTSTALVLGLILHSICTNRILSLFFQYMGMGAVSFEVNPYRAYILYPSIFILVILVAQWLVNKTIYKWHMKDLNED